MIELLNQLNDSGELRELFKGGYISAKVFHHMEIMNKFNALGNLRTSDKVAKISCMMRISERQVYRVIENLED